MTKVQIQDPHYGQPVINAGRPLGEAGAAMVMIHGRGATAESILSLAELLGRPDLAYLAPQATGNAWYPQRFIAPIASNEPFLASALKKVGAVLEQVSAAGIAPEQTILLGFSQGACLSLEYAARYPQRFGGVVALSGGLIGPPGTSWNSTTALNGTPVFIGCSDTDFHIPAERVHESADALARMGGDVTKRIYPGMGHTVNQDEIDFVRQLLARVAEPQVG
jgi:phospholipase/carboxylesterase